MKTTKLILIAAFLSFAAMGYSQTESDRSPFTARISLENAIQNPALVAAMHQQLSPDILKNEQAGRTFTARVILKRTIYVIYGTRDAWKKFFEKRLDANPEG